MSAIGIRNVFILKQSESNHTSAIEISLPSTDLLLGRILNESQKPYFQQSNGNKTVWIASENISDIVFIEILATIRSNGWMTFTSNAYLDTRTNQVIKSFYFEEDLSSTTNTSSSRRSTSGNNTSTAATAINNNNRNNNNNSSVRQSNEDSSKGHNTTAIPIKSSSVNNVGNKTIFSSTGGHGNNSNGVGRASSSSSSAPTYMKKLKEEEQEVARQSMMDRARMDPQELQLSEAEARQHENNRSAHYAKLGQNFVVGGGGDKRGGPGNLLKQSTRKT